MTAKRNDPGSSDPLTGILMPTARTAAAVTAHEAFPSEYIPLRDYIDAQLRETQKALEVYRSHAQGEDTDLRSNIETSLAENRQTLSKMLEEQKRADSEIRVEFRSHMESMNAERDRSTSSLREELIRSMTTGDARLLEHISNQVSQIQSALLSAEKLEQERVGHVASEITSVRTELLNHAAAADKAVMKAEVATEKRFDSVNEFRTTLADQTSNFMPRIETEQRIATNAEKAESLLRRLDHIESRSAGQSAMVAYIVAVLGTFGTIAGVVYAIVTGQRGP